MTTATITHSRIGPGLWIGVEVAAVAAVVVGLFGSAFAMWVVWLTGGAAAVVEHRQLEDVINVCLGVVT